MSVQWLRPPNIAPVALLAAGALALGGLAACATEVRVDVPDSVSPAATAISTPSAMSTPGTGASAEALPNACPDDGCQVRIGSVEASGGELLLDLEMNFAPDLSRNHVHVYWDHFTAEQVSDDAETRFQVSQGDWVPTADDPYLTGEATSVGQRRDSARICATAGDRDHNVVDPLLHHCADVSDRLTG